LTIANARTAPPREYIIERLTQGLKDIKFDIGKQFLHIWMDDDDVDDMLGELRKARDAGDEEIFMHHRNMLMTHLENSKYYCKSSVHIYDTY
jgi:hypothetical protein